MKENTLANSNTNATARIARRKGNPLSAKNMRLSLEKLQKNGMVDEKYTFKPENVWLYVKFSPNGIDSTTLKKVINNDKIMMQNYPFANAELYYDGADFAEERRLKLVDGDIYATLPTYDNPADNPISNIPVEVLDTLYMPEDDNDPIMFDAMVEGGFITDEQLNQRWRICWKKPEGYVRFTDTQLGANQPVSETKVWCLLFGLPLTTHADGNGYFKIHWRFLVGTLVGTKANNIYNKIIPINVTGSWFTSITNCIGRLLIGSLHIDSWYGACNINNVSINFTGHNQQRYWAHILRTSFKHREYCNQENIYHGQTALVTWALWDEDAGAASAPMLGHIGSTLGTFAGIANNTFDMADLNASAPSIFNALFNILPDVTYRISNTQGVNFSTSFSHTVFHELSHVTHFSRVGGVYWSAYIGEIVANRINSNSTCAGYGCGTYGSGHTQVGESWAEFLSTNFAKRYYGSTSPGALKFSKWAQTARIPYAAYITFNEALEYEPWFTNYWIPSGFYNDCMDAIPLAGSPNPEPWDLVQGLTIRELYLTHGISQNYMCAYIDRMLYLYPTRVNFGVLNELYRRNTSPGGPLDCLQ